jgi:Icc-related predicted phosphoesterase
MKIIALTDIHGRIDYLHHIITQVQRADLVLVAGDITNFGDREEAEQIIAKLRTWNEKILAVPGNCDRAGVSEILSSHKMNLHAATKIAEKVMFFGIGGSNKTPFHTPREYAEKEMTLLLARFKKTPDVYRYLFVSHAPPYKTKLDKVFFGFHVGSKAIRKFIEDFQPDIVVCGHIHEARGVDYIGKTLIINPGAFPKHYALIDFKETIHYELY